MQIGSSLLIAAQQHAVRPQPKPAFEARKEELFAPLDFKQTAEPAAKPQTAPGQVPCPGANLDIRV